LSAGSLGMVDLLVPEEQVGQAQQLIDRIEAGDFEGTEYTDDPENSFPPQNDF
jgi:hypothetical protein